MSRLEFPPGIAKDQAVNSWLCTPKDMMPALVNEYVELIGNSVTNEYCTCEWVIHPDDIDKAEGKRRLRKGEPSPLCWIHSKQGYLLGFFTWLFKVRNANPEDGSDGGLFKVRDTSQSDAGILVAQKEKEDLGPGAQAMIHDEPMMVVHGNADQMKWVARYLEMVKEGQALIDAGIWPKEMMKYLVPMKPKEPTLDDHIEAASDALSAAGIDPVTGKRFGEWKPSGVRNEPGITLIGEHDPELHPRQDYDG